MYDVNKLREYFPDTTVYKDQTIIDLFKAAKIESFLRDWIIKRKSNEYGQIEDVDELSNYIGRIIPSRQEKECLEDEARSNGETRPFLAKINITFNSKSNYFCFEIPDLGFTYRDTIIEDYVWSRIKDDLIMEAGGWGLVRIGYAPPEGPRSGKFTLLEFKNFCPYVVNLDSYREARKHFNTEEWMDILLGAIDYNADGFKTSDKLDADVWLSKHTMLTRLLPFIQPRVNLIELAPQQTGKSYVFGKIDKYGWMCDGGAISRAKLFYDMRSGAKTKGLVTFTDYVAIDEVKNLTFTNDREMGGILKNYMEHGYIKVGDSKVEGEAGIIFLGNIDVQDMSSGRDMLKDLPEIFRDTAFLQRIHGFIPGRYISPINPGMIMNGWALNTEYFTEIMHLMRSPSETMRYRRLVTQLIHVDSDTSDVSKREYEAIIRLCTAYMKLFFPHADSELIEDFDFKMDFNKYCLQPAIYMQSTVLDQMKINNPHEFENKCMASYSVR